MTAPTLDELRLQIGRMEGRAGAEPVATHPALAGLLQLRTGGTYAVSSAALAGLLMAGPSGDGAWCGIVGGGAAHGVASLGLQALAEAGVELSRCVLVPDPGAAWLEVAAALVDVLGVVVVTPPSRVGEGEAARLVARLRKRGAILICRGDWPRVDARVGLTDVRWTGVGDGHGHLRARQATVEVRVGTAPARTRRLWLPDVDLAIREVLEVAPARTLSPPMLRSVG